MGSNVPAVPPPPPPLPVVPEGVSAVNVAETDRFAFMTTVHVPVPEQPAPDQPVNVEPLDAVAVSTTRVLSAKGALQTPPQLIPVGDEVTLPKPDPGFVTVSVLCTGGVVPPPPPVVPVIAGTDVAKLLPRPVRLTVLL
jgi:hypothetical protein